MEDITFYSSMYGYLDIEAALVELISRLPDPKDESETAKALVGNVDNGHPDNLELFNGSFVKVVLSNKNDETDVGERVAKLKGMAIVYTPGKDGDSAGWCKYITDVIESFLEALGDGSIMALAGVNGCSINPDKNTNNWLPVNVDPQGKTPKWCTTGIINFTGTKEKEDPILVSLLNIDEDEP